LQRQTEEGGKQIVYLVDITEDCLLNGVMFDHFAQDASIATPNDKDFLRIRVRIHSEVGDHFLIAMAVVSHSKLPPAYSFSTTRHCSSSLWNEGSDIRKFVPFRALDDIIQDQHSTVVTALKDQDILELGLLMVKNLVDLERHGLSRPHVRRLNEPPICLFVSREEVEADR
jgi:hypothetical protein